MKIEKKKIYSKLRAAIVDLTETLDETVSFRTYAAAGANGGTVRLNGGARLSNFHAVDSSVAPDEAAYNNRIAAYAAPASAVPDDYNNGNRYTKIDIS